MLYYAVAAALKAFDLNPATRRAYRAIGNVKNRRAPGAISEKYFDLTPGILAELTRLGALRDGIDILEMGTGWTHWDALVLRNMGAARATLYDVWDNRSLARFQSYLRQLAEPEVRRRLGFGAEGQALMLRAAEAPDFETAYAVLGFDYLADAGGLLGPLPDAAYDLVVSRDVGEHMRREDLPAIAAASFAKLRPGGWAFHQIVLADHIRIYARKAHPKAYLEFDRETYRRWIASNIQYTNLVQVPEWRALFEGAGFRCVELKRVGTCDLGALKVHPSWAGIAPEDLACTVVQFYLQKPAA